MKRKQANKEASISAVEAEAPSRGTLKEKERGGNWREHAVALEAYVKRPDAQHQDIDVSDLPPELLKQLSVGLSDPLGAQLIEIFGDHGGCANLDQLLIGLYRRFRVVQNRRFLQNKIWRMVRKRQLAKADTRGMFCLASSRDKKRRNKKK